MSAHTSLLDIQDLSVEFSHNDTRSRVVNGVSLRVLPGETLALVGESGSGKSVTAMSILRLLSYPTASHPTGKILFDGKDLLHLSEPELRRVRGNDISMIFQEPMTALNPLHTLEKQIGETLLIHQGLSKSAARTRVIELLNLVKIRDPESRLRSYPHELSGGQRQRVMIAMALANNPKLLIADEPTTALDVTVQLQILELIKEVQQRLGMSVLLITHDLGIVRHFADRVAVMHQGKLVETASTQALFSDPQADYTKHLLASEPKGEPVPLPEETIGSTALSVENLRVAFAMDRPFLFGKPKCFLEAVKDASFKVRRGSTLGIIGESGSGKSTLAMAILRLVQSSGTIVVDGKIISNLPQSAIRPIRKTMQVVFQDPFGSLSPRMTVGDIIAEGLKLHSRLTKAAVEQEVTEVLTEVGLDPDARHRYPHEFSGGQRQRIAIARALILRPEIVFLDEPTSALDRAVQVQIVELLRHLQIKHGLTYVFISHDLKVVKALSHTLAVMKQGEILEYGEAASIIAAPQHPYTQELLNAAFA